MSGDQSCCFACALHNEDLEGLKVLLDSCVLSDTQAFYLGCDLLHKAQSWPERVKKFLLERDIKANSESESKSKRPLFWNGSPFCHVVGTDNIEVMKSLPQMNGDVQESRPHAYLAPLFMAAQLGNTEMSEVLLDHVYRGKMSNLETIKSLLQASIDANESFSDNSIAIELATQLATKEISNLLCLKNTELYIAAEANDTSLIRKLLHENADVDAKSHDDMTPLHKAAQLGNTKSAEILLNNGANASSVCASALCTLLDAAVRKERKALVELLLKKAVTGKNEGMLLDLAAARNNRAVVKLLLNNSVDNDVRAARDKNNKNMLRLAVERWNLPLIEQILEARSDLRNNQVDTQSHILEVLLQHGFTVGAEKRNDCILLHYAIRSGYPKIVEYLLNLGTNCNAKFKVKNESLPLHTAIFYNRIEIARLLIKNNADVNAKDANGRSPLHYVLHYCDSSNIIKEDIIRMLLVSGARVNEHAEDGKTALQIAASEGYEKVVELLLEVNADVNSVDDRAETPLHSSARSGSIKTIKLLLDHGAMINAKRNDGATALHIAVKKGHTDPVKLLIENGADAAIGDCFGVTPLHIAGTGYNSQIIQILLKICKDVDCRDEDGKTALHFASMYGSFAFVQALLDHGADINVVSNDGFTPVNTKDGPDSTWDNDIKSDYYVLDYLESDRSITDFIELDNDKKTTMMVFAKHIAKLTALNLYVNKQNLNAVKYLHYKDFVAQCVDEIKSLKQ